MKKVSIQQTLTAFILSFLALVGSNHIAFAASTTIGLSPSSGSYSKPFTVNMIIDGNGDKFNAAEATVTLSSNIKIQDLTLGDCNLSFLRTPSAEDPSFEGVIISTYSTQCTAYTMTLVPVAKGHASVTISNASAKRYGDAANILSSTSNASYTLTGTSPMGPELTNTSKAGLYTLYLKVTASNTPVPNASVILNAVSSKNKQQETTDKTGTAHFSNLQEGIYDAVINQGSEKIGETIINVSGSNHVLTLGIDVSAQKNNPLMKTGTSFSTLISNPLFLIGALVIGIIIGVCIALLIIKLLNKKKQ